MTGRNYYNLTDVGEKMRAVRKQRHLTVEQVRKYLGLECTQSIYKWERGDCLPQADTMIALCVFYRINPLLLFGEPPGEELTLGGDVNFDSHIETDIPTEPAFTTKSECSLLTFIPLTKLFYSATMSLAILIIIYTNK